MFPFVLFSALFSSIFTETRENRWVCNSSDATVWYDYCVVLTANTQSGTDFISCANCSCLEFKKDSKAELRGKVLRWISNADTFAGELGGSYSMLDLKNLRLPDVKITLTFLYSTLPCCGAGSILSTNRDNLKFPISIRSEPCITLKGSRGILYLYYIPRRDIKSLYFNIYLSTKSMNFPLRKEVICRGYDDNFSFCRALKGETVNTTIQFSFRGIRFSKGQYNCITEAIEGNTEEKLFCLNFTIIHYPDFN